MVLEKPMELNITSYSCLKIEKELLTIIKLSVLLTDLSKLFNCLSHELLIAKLHVYGLDIDSLCLLQVCSKNKTGFYFQLLQYSLKYFQALYLDHFFQYIYV